VGFVNGGPERDGRDEYDAELYALYVLPDWHGRGIGKQLSETFAQSLIDSGYDSMFAWVLAENPARGFYETLGGTLVDERSIEIGGRPLVEVAYGWNDLKGSFPSREGVER
jgi:GNAT superfamily N-acetyltransferase